MAEFASAADAPAARAVIHAMGFDDDIKLINLIPAKCTSCEVHDVATASSSAASFAAPAVSFSGPPFGFGTAFAPAEVAFSSSSDNDDNDDDDDDIDIDIDDNDDHDDNDDNESSSSSMPSNFLVFRDCLTGRRVSLALVADGKLLSPAQLRAQIMHPLELIKAAAWFFALQSSGMKRHREEPPPPLGHMLTEFSPYVPVRVMCGCVVTACRRLATAPAGVDVISRTTGRWAAWIMERVTWGRVRRVQVRLQRRACCAVRCACRANACVRCVLTRATGYVG